jgi:hypothetical protein
VLVVSHVTPIKTLLRMALHAGSGILYRFHLDRAPLSIAESYPDGVASVQQVSSACVLTEIDRFDARFAIRVRSAIGRLWPAVKDAQTQPDHSGGGGTAQHRRRRGRGDDGHN